MNGETATEERRRNGGNRALGAVPKLLSAAARPTIGAIGERRNLSRGSNATEEEKESGGLWPVRGRRKDVGKYTSTVALWRLFITYTKR